MPETRIEQLDINHVEALHAIELRGYPHPWSARIMRDTFKAGTACWGLLDEHDQVLGYAFFSAVATVEPSRNWSRRITETFRKPTSSWRSAMTRRAWSIWSPPSSMSASSSVKRMIWLRFSRTG